MTYAEATEALAVVGLPAVQTCFGLAIEVSHDTVVLRLEMGRASSGGTELSVRPNPAGLTVWFHRANIAAMVDLLRGAHRMSTEQHISLLDALLALSPETTNEACETSDADP